ncbi:MAG: amidase [Gammaproteobacteria bacterium]|jgi:Asp-tRNA(Asn)/Glu-tRNA(Gln) amidotransferase A subunit family amidase
MKLRLVLALALLTGSSLLQAQSQFEVTEASILEMQSALESGQVTSVELVQKYLARIAVYDRQGPALNSLVRVNPRAAEIAADLDTERRRIGSRGPLHGIPVIVKDNYNTDDIPTTGSSVALAGFIPTANATQVDRLIEAGAIILAKSNLHEFAYGITSISSLVGQTRNPYDPRRVPGGSSGGTGAAVAASLGAVGMGSDTCGSIRIPAAFNNLVGLRPSKGLSSIYGVMPLSHTQDVAGPLARETADLAIVLDAVSGYDPNDPATAIMTGQPAPGFLERLDSENLAGLRLGRLTDYFDRADSGVTTVINAALESLKAAGVEVVDIEIAELGALIAQSGLIGFEFRNDLNDYLTTFGSEGINNLAAIVDQGLYHQAVSGSLVRSRNGEFNQQAYEDAYAIRATLRERIEEVLEAQQLDALIYPPIGELQVFTGESQPGNNCSISANSGLPAISLPAGLTADGLPVGVELLGSFLSDTRLVAIAHQVEKLIEPRHMPLTTPPLERYGAPAPQVTEWTFESNGLRLAAQLSYHQSTRRMEFSVNNTGIDTDSLYALTLIVDEAPVGELNDPVVFNLLPPGSSSNQGGVFVSPELHQAILDNRLYLGVFARGLDSTGVKERLLFSSQ